MQALTSFNLFGLFLFAIISACVIAGVLSEWGSWREHKQAAPPDFLSKTTYQLQRLGPDETLVLSVPGRLSKQQRKDLSDYIENHRKSIPPSGGKVMIFDENVRVSKSATGGKLPREIDALIDRLVLSARVGGKTFNTEAEWTEAQQHTKDLEAALRTMLAYALTVDTSLIGMSPPEPQSAMASA
jgi:hypothetical protein